MVDSDLQEAYDEIKLLEDRLDEVYRVAKIGEYYVKAYLTPSILMQDDLEQIERVLNEECSVRSRS